MNISEIPTDQLVSDYKRLEKTESEYFKLCKKYDPDFTQEPDIALTDIIIELGTRKVTGHSVETIEYNPPPTRKEQLDAMKERYYNNQQKLPVIKKQLSKKDNKKIINFLKHAISKNYDLDNVDIKNILNLDFNSTIKSNTILSEKQSQQLLKSILGATN